MKRICCTWNFFVNAMVKCTHLNLLMLQLQLYRKRKAVENRFKQKDRRVKREIETERGQRGSAHPTLKQRENKKKHQKDKK